MRLTETPSSPPCPSHPSKGTLIWIQSYDPVASVAVSALLAAVPILFFLFALTVLKLRGTVAAAIALALELAVAVAVFGMPVDKAVGSGALGVLNGLWPIAWIVLMAVWLYKLTVASGRFDVIRTSISGISADQRIQVLLIAFCFGAFLEGAAGFGVPIAICAALLVQLGFRPLKAAMLCLVANAGAGAYGAVGIPVVVGAAQGGVPLTELSMMMIVVLQVVTLFVPLILVIILDGLRGVRETWPVVLLLGVLFSGSQSLVLFVLGPELADIVPSLLSLGFLALFMRVWKPSRVFREDDGATPVLQRVTVRQVIGAWSPFYILTGFILVWSLPVFKALFAPGGVLSALVVTVPIAGLDGQVGTGPQLGGGPAVAAIWMWTPVNATGTAILLAVLITYLLSNTVGPRRLWETLRASASELWRPILMILLIMAVASIAGYSGGSASIGLALAGVGAAFPLLSPVIGWFGVFITGSVVNNNNLFAQLQSVTAEQIGVNPTLLVAANTAGGVMAKLVSPQSIAIAAAAVKLTGQESSILRATLLYSLSLLAFICLWVLALSFLLD
ncbi:MAG: hypothetical protein RI885_762 [Actinomycetota bacterium]